MIQTNSFQLHINDSHNCITLSIFVQKIHSINYKSNCCFFLFLVISFRYHFKSTLQVVLLFLSSRMFKIQHRILTMYHTEHRIIGLGIDFVANILKIQLIQL